MPAIDFPASPTDGQLFSATNGVVYQWSATFTAWLALGGANSGAYVSSTPPSSPYAGQFWWSNETGALFIYYVDGTSSQWVPTNPSPQNILQQTFRVLQNTLIAGAAVPFVEINPLPGDVNQLMVFYHLVPSVNGANIQCQWYVNGVLQTANYTFNVWASGHTSPANTNVVSMTSVGAAFTGGIVLNYAVGGSQISNTPGHGTKGFFNVPALKAGRASLFGQASYLVQGDIVVMNCQCQGDQGVLLGQPVTGLRIFPSSGNWQIGGSFEVWGSP